MSKAGLVTEILANMAERHKLRFTLGDATLENEEFFADDGALPLLVGNIRNALIDRELSPGILDDMPFRIRASRASLAGYVLQADEVAFRSSHVLMLSAFCWKSLEDLLAVIGHNGLLSQTRSGAYMVDLVDFVAVNKTLNGEEMGLHPISHIHPQDPDQRAPIF